MDPGRFSRVGYGYFSKVGSGLSPHPDPQLVWGVNFYTATRYWAFHILPQICTASAIPLLIEEKINYEYHAILRNWSDLSILVQRPRSLIQFSWHTYYIKLDFLFIQFSIFLLQKNAKKLFQIDHSQPYILFFYHLSNFCSFFLSFFLFSCFYDSITLNL